LPGLRPSPWRGLGGGGFFPGRSSVLGGIDEFPLLRGDQPLQPRDPFRQFCILCPQLRVLGFSSAFSARSPAFAACSKATTSGASGTPALHQSRPSQATRNAKPLVTACR